MINTLELLKILKEKGIRLGLDEDDNLVIKGDKDKLGEELLNYIRENKESLVALLKDGKETRLNESVKIEKVPANIPIPASFSQQRLWIIDKIDGSSAHYNMSMPIRMIGVLNRKALEDAVKTIVVRHQSLRTVFTVEMEGKTERVYQQVKSPANYTIKYHDFSDLENDERYFECDRLTELEETRPFNLSSDYMLRCRLIKCSTKEHIFIVTMHHIASDGWSMNILVDEFATLYRANIQGLSNPLPPLEIQYTDYAYWQHSWLQGDRMQSQLRYWERQLAELPLCHSLPLDYPRPKEQTYRGAQHLLSLGSELVSGLQTQCVEHSATLYMGLHTILVALIARFSNEDDIVIGTPIANREQDEISELIGFFVNTLVLRSHCLPDSTFRELLIHNKQVLLEAYQHQQTPFEKLVEHINPPRSLNVSPLFQILLVQDNARITQDLPELQLELVHEQDSIEKFDLTLTIREDEDQLNIHWSYNTDLFKLETVECMANCFLMLAKALIENPDCKIGEIALLDNAQDLRIHSEWNNSYQAFPEDKCIHQLIEEQVKRTPDASALVFEAETLSYTELNQRANRLAHYLHEMHGLDTDMPVGLHFERSTEMVIGMLAVLKAGSAYVPLEPELPDTRLQAMIDDARIRTVLSLKNCPRNLKHRDVNCVYLDDPETLNAISTYPETDLPVATAKAHNLAYIIYTSGSTGRPKGVMVEHRALVNRIDWMHRQFSCGDQDSILQKTPFSFDVSVWEFLWPLIAGAKLVLARPHGHKDPFYLSELIRREGVTKMHFVPSMLNSMLTTGELNKCRGLQQVFCSGEALTANIIERFQKQLPNTQLHNLYGPTEAAIDVSHWDCQQFNRTLPAIPIGKSIQNIQLYVLNSHMQLCPVGTAGELYIGGVGLARGYIGQEELSKKQFVDNPFYDASRPFSSKRLYKTGDLARWQSDGNLLFLGRKDHQVKLRGFRIELGEIEQCLIKHEKVREAVVLLVAIQTEENSLVAYITGDIEDQDKLLQELKLHCSRQLPEYMVPDIFVVLEALPLNTSGKINRKALPKPDIHKRQARYIAPGSDIEKKIAKLWQGLLNIEKVGLNDNFFSLGGHSLLVTTFVGLVKKELHKTIRIKSVFDFPILQALANHIESVGEDAEQSHGDTIALRPDDVDIPASYNQKRLWMLDRIDGANHHYNLTVALNLKGHLNKQALQVACDTIVERHAILRTVYKENDHGDPVQVILDVDRIDIHQLDFSRDSDTSDADCIALIQQEMLKPFDFASDLMLRCQLIKRGASEHILVATVHHIASDGWSMGILVREFSELYKAFASGQGNPLAALPIQYADYAYWQLQRVEEGRLKNQFNYWRNQLANLPVVHNLPLDFTRPKQQTFNGSQIQLQVASEQLQKFRNLLKKYDATLFMGLHTVFSILLARYSNDHDIVIGTPIANREHPEIADLIGFFVNTLVLRMKIDEACSFEDLLQQSKQSCLEAYANQQAPFEQIVETLQPERSLNHNPLFQIMLVLQNHEEGELDLGELQVEVLDAEGAIAKFDLMLVVNESSDGMLLHWEYNTDLFKRQSIQRLAGHFVRFLETISDQPDKNIHEFEIIGGDERDRQIHQWNNTTREFPDQFCIHQLIEQQVLRSPQAPALEFEDSILTYAELNERANRLANYLITRHQLQTNKPVGLCFERSFELVVGMLAILKTGAAYVPLEPGMPYERLRQMADDAKIDIALSIRSVFPPEGLEGIVPVFVDDPLVNSELMSSAYTNPAPDDMDTNKLAYVIYTSGSSGRPKGVMVEHRALVNRIDWMHRQFGCQPDDVILQKTPFGFDVSVWEFLWPLMAGAKLLLARPEGHKDPYYLASLIRHCAVTKMHFVPSMLNSMLATGELRQCTSLRQVFCSGEALQSDTIMRFQQQLPGTQLHNLYGPTEAAIDVSHWDCRQINGTSATIPIGKPIQNIQLYVLNRSMRLCPVGTVGELYIGGVGLARGYINQSDLTARQFVANPFHDKHNPASSKRLYKTGDLARWQEDGNLLFLGRRDHQIKLRGFRIELAEIENAISRNEHVNSVVVVLRQGGSDDRQDNQHLVAYLELTGAVSPDIRETLEEGIRQQLGHSLPEYMLPTYFVLLDTMPLTANGKINRAALPEPDTDKKRAPYQQPLNELQEQLCTIWQEVLGVERVGIDDNFFRLGGHSLSVIRLVASINKKLHANIAAKTVFENDTVRKLAQNGDFENESLVLAQRAKGYEKLARIRKDIDEDFELKAALPENAEDIFPLSAIQESMVYFAQAMPDAPVYHDQFPFLVTIEDFNFECFRAATKALSRNHPILRTSFDTVHFAQPMQIVHEHLDIDVKLEDLSAIPEAQHKSIIEAYCSQDLNRKFQFVSGEALWRLQLFLLGNDRIFIVHTVQHAILDGWSLDLLRTELLAHYETIQSGNEPEAIRIDCSYKDYLAVSLARVQSESAEAYWKNYLRDYSRMKLPFNYLGRMHNAEQGMLIFNRESTTDFLDSLIRYSDKTGYSIKEICLSAYVYLLTLITGDSEILTGVVSHDRPELPDADKVLGCFLNTLPLRLPARSTVNTEKLLSEVQNYLREVKQHELFLGDIARLTGDVNPAVNPLFDTIFNFTDFDNQLQDKMFDSPSEPDARVLGGSVAQRELDPLEKIAGAEMTNTLFDFEVHKVARRSLFFMVKYSPRYFLREEIESAFALYITILERILSGTGELTATEFIEYGKKSDALQTFNQTSVPYDDEARIPDLIARAASKSPNATAITMADRHCSYVELEQNANRVAHMLRDHGIRPGDKVAAVFVRSIEMVIALLGIMKAGGVYVPMEPDYPKARKLDIANSAKISAVLCDENQFLDEQFKHIVYRDENLKRYPDTALDIKQSSRELAYIIYTSGSTGKPKGVRIQHHSVVNLITWVNRTFNISSHDVMMFITSVCFDLSVYDIFGILAAGGRIVIGSNEQVLHPEMLIDVMQKEQVTFWDSVPTTISHLVVNLEENDPSRRLDSLRLVFMSGDWIPVQLPPLIKKFFPNVQPISLGGATEGTVWSNYHVIEKSDLKRNSIPYGRPIDNNRFYVLDGERNPVFTGVAGELYIAGLGVADGYQGDPEKTAKAFYSDPFVEKEIDGQKPRMYRTGDLGRISPAGYMEILGRIDHQVKLRGFRIELGEIESAINQHPQISAAVAKVVEFDHEEASAINRQVLVAYIIVKSGESISREEITAFLAQTLAHYMIPRVFIEMREYPLNTSGKVDRHALPVPDIKDLQEDYEAPRTQIEADLSDIWTRLLGINKIGINDNFFHLGGHSLLATRLITQTNKHFEVNLTLEKIFTSHTIKQMAQIIEEELVLNSVFLEDSENLDKEGTELII